jgi:hypothetical protein
MVSLLARYRSGFQTQPVVELRFCGLYIGAGLFLLSARRCRPHFREPRYSRQAGHYREARLPADRWV